MSKKNYISRRYDLIDSISRGYAKSLADYTTKDIKNITNFLNVSCGKTTQPGKLNSCESCLNTFVDTSVLFPCPGHKICPDNGKCPITQTASPDNHEPMTCTPTRQYKDMFGLIANMGGSPGPYDYKINLKGVCAGSCNCTVKDITMDNMILVNKISSIKKDDPRIQDILDYTNNRMTEIYGEDYSAVDNEQITNIVTKITDAATANITQMSTSFQTINVKDGNAIGIQMNIAVNGVMKAIIENQSSIDIVNEILETMVANIRKKVDSEFIGGFKQLWAQFKWSFIGLGIFLMVLFIAIVIMLFYKAARPRPVYVEDY